MSLLNSLLKNKGSSALDAFEEQPEEVHKTPGAEFDHSLRYFFIFGILGVASAAWVSSVLVSFESLPTPGSLLNIGLVCMALFVVMLFQAVMVQSWQYNFILVIVEALVLPVFFYPTFSAWFLFATLAFAVSWLLGFSRARTFLSGAMTINFWRYSAMMITTTITAMALFMSFLYVGLYQREGGITFNAYKFVVSGAAPGVQYVAPNFNPETKVSSFLEGTIKGYFDKQDQFGELPAATRQSTLSEAVTGVEERISGFTKIALKPGETIASYTFRWLSDGIKALQERGLGGLVVVGIFLLIYFAIKSVMFFVKWPVIGFCFMIYLLLQAVGIISIGTEMRQKEMIIVR